MKTLAPTNLIAVEVPKDANDFRLYFEFGHTRMSYNEKSESEIPITNYTFQNLFLNEEIDLEILGEFTDTEFSFDVETYVEKTDNPYWYSRGFPFIDYTNDSNCFKTSIESFTSILNSNGYPYEEPHDAYKVKSNHQILGKWQKFEKEKTIIKGKLIILKLK